MTMNAATETARPTFAGVTFKPTKRGKVARPALLKMLRSGRVRVVCSGHYTDDYAYDAANNFGKGACPEGFGADLANDIERSPSGWRAYLENGVLSVGCHTFLSYKVYEVEPEPVDPHAEEVARLEAWIG